MLLKGGVRRPSRRKCFCFLLLVSLFSLVWVAVPLSDIADHLLGSQPDPSVCLDVLSGAAIGHWVPKPNVSESRRQEMDLYLRQIRGEFGIPASLQRNDGRCGDVAYDGVNQYKHMWFRAVCNPVGATPCCDNFRCRNVTTADCTCPSCIDSRSPVHAELSDWLPVNRACAVREMNTSQACAVLKGTSFLLVGDSLVRQIFIVLVMLLSGNFQNGVLRKDANADIQAACQGMYQVNRARCRYILNEAHSLCENSVNVTYREVFPSANGGFLLPLLRTLTSQDQRVLLVTGVGIHDNYRLNAVWRTFLEPLVEYISGMTGGSPVTKAVLNLTEYEDAESVSTTTPSMPLSSSSSSSSSTKTEFPSSSSSLSISSSSSSTLSYSTSSPLLSLVTKAETFVTTAERVLTKAAVAVIRPKRAATATNTTPPAAATTIFKTATTSAAAAAAATSKTATTLAMTSTSTTATTSAAAVATTLKATTAAASETTTTSTMAATTSKSSLTSKSAAATASIKSFKRREAVTTSETTRSTTSASTSTAPTRRLWPKLVWANAHAPGVLKSPLFSAQSIKGVTFFNRKIARLLEPYGVPILDSFNLTAPLHAVDGTHYGYGANMLKVQILLRWVVERQERGEW